jgi:hypothetical protein
MTDNQEVRLIIDDSRTLEQCYNAVKGSLEFDNPNIFKEGNWTIVRTYDEFVNYIKANPMPDIISFDHDLADFIEVDGERIERTGKTCANWLVEYCMDNNVKLPEYHVHSSNARGIENIKSYLDNYKRVCE